MSIPAGRNPAELPESAVSELHALYREGAADEPDLLLDRRILEAARDELHADQTWKAKHSMSWWKTWARPTSAIAVMVLGLSLTWNVIDEQERALRDGIISAENPPELAGKTNTADVRSEAAATVQAPLKDQAPKALAPMTEKKQVSESQAVTAAEPQSLPARQNSAASKAGAIGSPAQPSVAADAPAVVRGRQAVAIPVAPGIVAPAPAPAPAFDMPKAEAVSELATKSMTKRMASPAMNKEADAANELATPEAWLDQIRKLRASGRTAEAGQSLERFRKRYPGVVLPDDLLELISR